MNYEPKSYLYYKLLDLTEYNSRFKFEKIIEYLGDFNIEPGSIQDVKNEHKYVCGIKCENFSFNASTFTCLSFSYDRMSGNFTINGNIDDTPISVKLGFNLAGALDRYTINISDINSGLYIIRFDHYDDGDLQRIIYYDQEAIKALVNSYNISYTQLFDIQEHDIDKLGIKPDCKRDFNEHMLNQYGNTKFIKELFSNISWNQLRKSLSDIIKDAPERGSRKDK